MNSWAAGAMTGWKAAPAPIVLDGGAGTDWVTYGIGEDTDSYVSSDDGEVVRLHSLAALGCHAEGDTFTEGWSLYRIAEVPEIEHLIGSSHDDTLAGDVRNNTLKGRDGDDTLYGGPDGGDLTGCTVRTAMTGSSAVSVMIRFTAMIGNDTIYGGAGDDVRSTAGLMMISSSLLQVAVTDTITDFTVMEMTNIDLSTHLQDIASVQ